MRVVRALPYVLVFIAFVLLLLTVYGRWARRNVTRSYAYPVTHGLVIVGQEGLPTEYRLPLPGISTPSDVQFRYSSGVLVYASSTDCREIAVHTTRTRYVDTPTYLREAESLDRICLAGQYVFFNVSRSGKQEVALLDTASMRWDRVHGAKRVRANRGILGVEESNGTILISDSWKGKIRSRWKPGHIDDWDVGQGRIFAVNRDDLYVVGVEDNRVSHQRKVDIGSPTVFWQDGLGELWVTDVASFSSTIILCYDGEGSLIGVDRRGCGTGMCVQYAPSAMVNFIRGASHLRDGE